MTQIFTGSKYHQNSLLIETLEDRILYDAAPVVTIDTEASVGIGETLDVTVVFENGDDTDTGYGPWIDVAIKALGTDGIADPNDPSNPQTGDTDGIANPGDQYDGFTLATPPAFLGQSLNYTVITIDDNANEGMGVLHPYAVDITGQGVYVHTQNGPFSDLLQGFGTGDVLLVIELPFGSYSPDQPGAEVTFSLDLSSYADVGEQLPIAAQGGFRYGNDPLDNPTPGPSNGGLGDPSIIGGADVEYTTVDATLATLTKEYIGPEGETATGPNFERTYRISIDIADGQTLSDLNIFDQLSDQVQFVGFGASSHGYTVHGEPSTSVPGGELHISFDDPIVGTDSSEDAWIEVRFYVPRLDANGDEVIPEESGAFINIENQAYGYGTWTPEDPRDPEVRLGLNVEVNPDADEPANPDLGTIGGPENVFEAQSIAVQKGVEIIQDNGGGGMTPGDILEYTIDFQVSDYFAFGNIVITDWFSDGQEFLETFVPTLSINGNTFVLSAADFHQDSFIVSAPDPITGVTTVTFNISAELIRRALDEGLSDEAKAGLLLGGGIDPNDPTWAMTNGLDGLGDYNDGATTGQIIFRTLILDEFRVAHLQDGQSREASLNPRDVLTNDVEIEGEVLDLENSFAGTGNRVSDDSSESIVMEHGDIRKEIYAINGILTTDSQFDSQFRTGGNPNGTVNISPGDTVTYRLVYTVPSGDVEQFRFADYLPKPVFDATELNTFDGTKDGTPPPAGTIKYGADHTLDEVNGSYMLDADGNPLGAPQIDVDAGNNSFELYLGTTNDTDNEFRVIDILFTVTVNNSPFADGMYLTNQALSGERSTQQPATEANALAIVQVVLGQPVVDIYKGVVASTQQGGEDVSGVQFADVSGNGFVGTVSGEAAATAIGDLDLLSGQLPDAGDIIRYALVVQNTGRSDAFDVTVRDTIRGSYVNDYADADVFRSATNFRVYNGGGAELDYGTDYTLSWDNVAKEFEVVMTDHALGRGFDASIDAEVTNGSNAIVVLYDLEVDLDAQASSQVSNTAELTHYAGETGGSNHLAAGVRSDDAEVLLASPTLVKQVVSTSHNVSGNNDSQAVIGEVITWSVTITVPEGTTDGVRLVDILDPGLGYLDTVSIVYSPGVSSSLSPTDPTVGNINGGTNNQLTYDFGTVTNTNTNNGVAETITITYQTVVLNTNTVPSSPGNQAGTVLDNSATLEWEWTNDPNGAVESDTITVSGDSVVVVEPALTVDKQVSGDGSSWVETLTGVDAGDEVYYQIIISNTAAGTTHAYNTQLRDRLPAHLVGATIDSVSGGALTSGDFQITGAMLLENVNPNGFTLEQGQTVTIIIRGTLGYEVNPNELITNTAEITWTSLPDDEVVPGFGERTGEDGEGSDSTVLNNYADSDGAEIRITNPAPIKSIISTSENHTTGTDVAIGEVVRYRIVLQVVEGTTENLVIRDNLPTGMQYLGNAKIAFVSLGDNLSSSTAGLGGAYVNGSSGNVAPTWDIPAGLIVNANGGGTFLNGEDVLFNLGTITNNADNSAGEYIVIEFNALVLNVSGNQHGTELNNTVTVTQDGDTLHNNVAGVEVTVVEPTLTVSKTVNSDISDAGDPISYTITISNSSGVDAFNVTLEDILPDAFHLLSGSSSIGDLITSLTGPAGVTLANFELTSYTNGTERVLQTTTGGFTLRDGETVTLTLSGVVSGAVSPNEVIENEVDIEWTSLPGEGTSSNPTGSDTPGDSGDANGERTGSGGVNDYSDSSEVASTAVNEITVTKHYHQSSDAGTSDAAQQVTIGEVVTYAIYIDLPEGTVVEDGLVITDFVPAGMQYVGHQLVTSAAGSEAWNGSFWLSDDFYGTVDPAEIDVSYVIGGDLTFTFGEIVIFAEDPSDPGALTNNAFVLLIDMQVMNVVGNQAGDTLVNEAEWSVSPDPDNPESPEDTNTVIVTIVEPELSVEKELLTPGNSFDEGDVVEYQITINAADGPFNSQANQVTVRDLIPAELTLDLGSIQITLNDALGVTNSSLGNQLEFLIDSINPGGSVIITFSATVNTAIAGSTITNEVDIDWTSLISTTETEERTGSGIGPNDYADSDSEDFLISVPSIIKSVIDTSEDYTSGTEVTIGEIITYEIVVTIPEGVTEDLIITDLVQANAAGVLEIQSLVLHSWSADLSWTGTPQITFSDLLLGDGLDDQAQIEFGNVTNSNLDNNIAETIVIRVTARVVNVEANQNGDILSNEAVLDYTDGTDGATSVSTGPVNVDVVESELQIEKGFKEDVSNLDAGDTVTYLITISHTGGSSSDAFDLIVRDELPVELESYRDLNARIMDETGLISTNVTARFTIDGNGHLVMSDAAGNPLNLKQGETLIIEVSATVPEDTLVGTTIHNEATLLWTSLEDGLRGDQNGTLGERTGTGGGANDYADEDEVEVKTRGALAVSKTSDKDEATIGEIVTYSIEVTVAEGRTIIDLLDTLPDGVTLLSTGFSVSDNAANLLFDFDGVDFDIAAGMISGQLIVTSNGGTGNDGSTAQDATFTLTYQVRVDNVADNSGDSADQTGLDNTVVVSSDLDQDVNTPDDTDTDGVTVTVVEPRLEVTKEIKGEADGDVDELDAGDMLTYQIAIGHTAASTSDAFDLIISDELPDALRDHQLLSANIVVGGTSTSVMGLLSIVNGTLVVTDPAGNPLNLKLGESLVIEVSGIVKDDTRVGTIIENEVLLLWTSLEDGLRGDEAGGTDTERTGRGGGANDYEDEDGVSVQTRGALAVTKSADKSEATIGEIVTYTIEITVAEGQTIVNLEDHLPTGLTFLEDLQIGSNLSGLLITGLQANSLTQTLTVTSNGGTSNDGSTGHDVTFTLVYTARVDNISDNVGLDDGLTGQTELDNTVEVSADLDNDSNTPDDVDEDEVTVTVVEPQLQIEKTISSDVSELDAGDTMEYQIRIRHTGSSTSNAYELILNDSMPAELRNYELVSAWIGASDVSGALTLNTTTGVLSTSGDIDLNLGSELVITLRGIVRDDTTVGTTIHNEAILLWSSHDGGLRGDEAGGADTERTGVAGDPNDPNDPNTYNDQDDAEATTRGALAVAKSADKSEATIGEIVTYTIEITVAEGRTVVDLLDTLPTGLTFIANSLQISSNSANLIINGLDANSLTQSLEILANSVSGTVGNDGSTAQNVSFTLTYQARVDNIVDNSGDIADQTTLTNEVEVSADLDNDGTTGGPGERQEDIADIDVVEPRLEVAKEIISDTTELDAGDTLTYRITVGHTVASTSDAFDLIISDELPDALRNHQLLSANIVIGATSTNVSGLLSIVNGTLVVTDPAGNPLNLKLGESLVIEVSGIVKDDTRVGTIIKNEVLLLWTSLEEGLRGDEAGDTDTERTGVAGDPNDPDDPNTYRDEDEDSAQTRGALAVTKSADKSEATIGEIVTYTIEITVAEGQTIVNLEDHLPTGLTFLEDLQIGSNLSGLLITGLQANSLTQTLTVTSNGGTSNDGSTGHDVTFTLVYTARVDNISDNVGLDDGLTGQTELDNTVEVSADLDNDSNTPNDVDEDEVIVTVVEPQLEIEKTISSDVSELDAGDTVEYQIRIRHTGSSTSNAYELILNDSMPAELRNYELVSAWIGGTDVSGALDLDAITGVLSTSGDIDLNLGSELVITLRGIVRDDTTVGTTIHNEAILLWSSHDGGLRGDEAGGADTERTGVAGDPNDPNDPNTYNDQDDVEATTRGALAVAKSADKSEATIGEIVTYTIEITVAEGRTVVDLLDTLPTGLTFIANSLQIGSNSANLIINGLDANSLTQSLEILANSISGTVGNDGSTAQNVSFTLTYQARVDNIVDNSGDSADQTNLENRVEVEADLDNDGTTGGPGERQEDTADIDVVEPRLDVTKEIISDTTALDAGDTLTYRITVGHSAASTSDAFDLILSDELPDALRNHQLLSANIVVGATSTSVNGLLSIVNGTLVVTDPAGNPLNLKLGESLVIEVSGIVKDDTRIGTIIENEVLLLWTSLEDGLRGDQDGDEDTERTGRGGGANDYEDEDEVSAQTRGALAVAKSSDKSEATIGEIITYTIEITVAEGQTIVNLEDHLPTGLTFLEDLQIGSNLFGLQITGLQANSLTQTLTVTSNGGTSNDGSTGHDVTFTLVYTARVDNIVDNSGDSTDQTELENRVEVSADLDNDSNTPDDVDEDEVTVTVVEPQLEIEKTISSDVSELDAGDTVEYQIRIRHTGSSTSNAYELILNDSMPAELRNYELMSAWIGGTDVSGALTLDTTTGVLSTSGDIDLDLGSELVITLRGIVRDDTTVGTTIHNEAILLWSSHDGGLRGDEAGGADTERTGVAGDPNDPNDPNTYNDQDDVEATTRGALAVAKSVDKSEATIGEIVTYTIEITVAEGRTVVDLLDTLPTGLTFIANSLQIGSNSANLVINGLDANSLSQSLEILTNYVGGTVGNDGSTAQNVSFTLTYQARVDNIADNSGDSADQTTLTNEVEVSADLDNDSNTPDDVDEDEVTVTVVEPQLEIEKTISNDVSELDAGDTVEYQIRIRHTGSSTSNAYELILNDSMPAELRNYELVSAWIGGTDVSGALALNTTTGVLSTSGDIDLDLGSELVITLRGIVRDDTTVGTTIHNEAILLWSSHDGGLRGDEAGGADTERTGVAGDPNDPNDPNTYNDQDDVEATTRGALAVAKSADKSEATIGEIVTYTIEITVAEGRTVVDLLDTLPTGLTFIANSLQIGSNSANLVINGLDANSLSQSLEILTNYAGGTVGNDGSTAQNVSFTLTYQARVDNIADNSGDSADQTNLENRVVAEADLDNDGTTGGPDERQEDTADIDVVEPRLEVTKEIISDTTELDAGDTLTYRITVGHTAASTSDAFDLILSDELPDALRDHQLLRANIVVGATSTNVSGLLSIVNGTLVVTDPAGNPLNLKLGESLVIEVSGIVKDDTRVGTIIENEVLLLWTSLEDGLRGDDAGGEDTERTGVASDPNDPDDPNTYRDEDEDSAQTRGALAVTKSADKSEATIGEIVTYTIEITVAEGQTVVNLEDHLPTGLTFLEDLQIGSNLSGLLITGLQANSLTQTLTVTSNGGTSNDGSTGHDVTFTLVYTARVDNIADNSGDIADQTNLENRVVAEADLDNDGTTGGPDERQEDTADIDVVEPRLEVTKEIISDTTELDAGDTLTYRITVGHTAVSTSDAFDLIISDDLPDALRNHQLLSVNIVIGATSTNVSGLLSIVNGTLVVTDPAGNPLNLKLGESLVIEVSGIVKDDTRVGTIIENEVLLLWTSLENGLVGDEAGDTDTERTGVAGDPNDPDDPNTYRDEDEDSAQTRGALAVTKSADKSEATIGEIVTYTIEITVAEGQTIVNLEDHLPTGLTFLEDLQIGSNLSGLLITGLQTNSLTQTLTVTSNGGTSNDGSTGHDVTFTLVYTARVDNIADNSGDSTDQTELENRVEVSADLDNDSNTPDDVDEDEVTVTVVEPQLEIEKTISNDVNELDAGDTVEYQIRIRHTGSSTSNAYELILNDSMPVELRNYELVSAWIGGTDVSGALALDAITGVLSTSGDIDLDLGSELVITLRGIVRDDTTVGTTIHNEAILLWSSHDGGLRGDEAGGTDTERTGVAGDPNDPNDPNTYNDQDDVEATTRGALAVAKRADKSEATIGEIVTYTIEITVAEGRTVVDLLDTLPTGLTFIANSLQIGSNSANLIINGLDANSLTQSLEILANSISGTVGNDGSTAQNVSFTLTYQARVDNIVDNSGDSANQTNLENRVEVEADLDNDGTTGGAGEQQHDTADVDVVEPRLEVEKTASKQDPHLGETITYTIVVGHAGSSTSTAYDLVITDLIPTDKLIQLGNFTITPSGNSTAVIESSSLTGWTIRVDQLELGETITITYEATITETPTDVLGGDGLFGTIDSNDDFTNTVDVTWSSLDGDVSGERDGSGDPLDPNDPNNYNHDDEETVTVVGADLALVKDDGITTIQPGDVWNYTITITNNGTDTATGVIVTDVLHPELIFKSATFGGTYDATTRTVTWNLADIAVGTTVTIEVEVELVAVVSAGLEDLTNTASVTHDDIDPTSDDVPNPPYNDNEDPDTNVIDALPDLVVVKTEVLTNGEARNNTLLQYEITVTNVGNQDASDVILTDDFDQFLLSFLSTSHNGTFDGDLIVWDLGTIRGGGGSVTVVVEARVHGPVPQHVEEVTNVAWATFDEDLSGKDPTPENNTDEHTIHLRVAPDMVVVKSTTVDELGVNEILLYTIEVSNAGPQNATNVVVVDNLPSEFVFISASHGGVYDAATHTVTWNSATTPQFGVVLGQSQQKITLELKVQLATGEAVVGDVTNVVRVTDDGSNGPDENPSNNEDNETVRVVGFTYDSFHNFSRTSGNVTTGSWGGFESGWTGKRAFDWVLYPIETHADPILPLAPIYSGAAEAGSTLVIVLYNAKGEEIGRQSVVVDAGGNWMATFPGAVVKDYPQSVQISQVPSSIQTDDNHGYNLRPYYATALNTGHFFSEVMTVSRAANMTATVVTDALYSSVNNPIGFDIGKHNYEFITVPGHPTGY